MIEGSTAAEPEGRKAQVGSTPTAPQIDGNKCYGSTLVLGTSSGSSTLPFPIFGDIV